MQSWLKSAARPRPPAVRSEEVREQRAMLALWAPGPHGVGPSCQVLR
ncbi:hypothetical protein [Mobilicoccus pelagius]|nr:hypothetical protein [Mobilicoccus pelagius]